MNSLKKTCRVIFFAVAMALLQQAAATAAEKIDEPVPVWTLERENAQSWGNRFSIGIPVGLFMHDMAVGLDFNFAIARRFSIRLDVHALINPDTNNIALHPSIVFIGKSKMFDRMKFYGGLSVGAICGLAGPGNGQYFMNINALGGIEFFASYLSSFFIEVGGGGNIATTDPGYGRGVFIRAGTRFNL